MHMLMHIERVCFHQGHIHFTYRVGNLLPNKNLKKENITLEYLNYIAYILFKLYNYSEK